MNELHVDAMRDQRKEKDKEKRVAHKGKKKKKKKNASLNGRDEKTKKNRCEMLQRFLFMTFILFVIFIGRKDLFLCQ